MSKASNDHSERSSPIQEDFFKGTPLHKVPPE